jgi:hypothetical protein
MIVRVAWYLQHPQPWFVYFSGSASLLPWGFVVKDWGLRTFLPPISFLVGGILRKLSWRGSDKCLPVVSS